VVTLRADASTVRLGEVTALQFTATGATSCTLSSGGSVGVGGSIAVAPTQTTTFTYTCVGPGGSASATATVTVSPCANECFFDASGALTSCTNGNPISSSTVYALDIGAAQRGVYLDVEVCDPTGFTVVLSDSATSDGFGGDSFPGATCYDSEIELNGTTVNVYRNDFVGAGTRLAFSDATLVAAAGCTRLRMVVEDSLVRFNPPAGALLTEGTLLRLSPSAVCPIANDGQVGGDRRFVLALERTPANANRSGAGLASVYACLR
jgi:hypothetical protein